MNRSLTIYGSFLAGLILLFLSVIFRIQHWPQPTALFWAGCAAEVLFYILVYLEIFNSKKADVGTKAFWLSAFSVLLISCFFVYVEMGMMILVGVGILYLFLARKMFVPKKDQ